MKDTADQDIHKLDFSHFRCSASALFVAMNPPKNSEVQRPGTGKVLSNGVGALHLKYRTRIFSTNGFGTLYLFFTIA